MTVIDSHVHFWDPTALTYPWIEKASAFDRRYLPADYQRATDGLSVEKIVFVECDADADHALAEAEWAARLTQVEPRIQAIVARVALIASSAEAQLEKISAMPLVRGIRDNIQHHAPGFALQARFIDGVNRVHRLGLHFELCVQHHQLSETIELVKRCPRGHFVLDHCAKPDIRSDRRQPWAAHLRELADLPNVDCKISGLVTEADWRAQGADDVLWYARTAAERFGSRRILFGSDWPINELAGGNRRWFALAEQLADAWNASERDLFFRGNAQRVYRLAAAPT